MVEETGANAHRLIRKVTKVSDIGRGRLRSREFSLSMRVLALWSIAETFGSKWFPVAEVNE